MRLSSKAIRAQNESGSAALIGYLPLGYPSVDKSIEAAKVIIEGGVDVLELGFPYSDPGMDGPVIEKAAVEALKAGTHLEDLFGAVREIRQTGAPILSMTYWNPVHWYGVDRFSAHFRDAGGAGLITPDLPPEEAGPWTAASNECGLERVFLAAPSSSPQRLRLISESTNAWVYAASTMGVTGQRSHVDSSAKDLVARCREAGAPLVCVGLGVSTGAQAREIASYADGVIVGSAFVKRLSNPDWHAALDNVFELARELKQGTTEGHV